MITLSKIAKLAHVSVSTVSKAFAMSVEVNEETRETIFRIAKENGCFKKYYRAKYQKWVVAVICPEFGSRYYADALSVIQTRLSEYGCEICVAATNFSEENFAELLDYYNRYTAVDAIILMDCHFDKKLETELPVGAVNSSLAEGVNVWVNVDSTDALTEALIHLKSSGIKEIGFIGEPNTNATLEFLKKIMKELEMEIKDDNISVTDMRFEQGGYDAMQKLFDAKKVPRALVCAYDYLDIGAIKCISDNGLSVPEDVAIMGNCQIREAEFINPSLSSIDRQIEKACVIVTDEIINVLSGNTREYSATLNATFNKRKSTQISDF